MNTLQQQTVPTTPVLKNVGVMGKNQLDDILSQFTVLGATIDRGQITIRVLNPQGMVVLSSAKIDFNLWHVRAVEGLLVKA